MNRTAVVFPGQGSQSVGMGRALAEAFREARDTFAEADDVLSQALSRLIFEGPEGELTLTENTQPALFTVSAAVLRVYRAQIGEEGAAFYAGHSLGEYAALFAAGSLSFADALRLLRLRGAAMQRAVPAGVGGMAAVLGLEAEAVAAACAEASRPDDLCTPANDNSPGQIVISGHADALTRAGDLLKARGAKRVLPLNVSAPFHSPLMQPAAEAMRAALAEITLQTPRAPIVCNVTAAPETDPGTLRALLVRQVCEPVRWRESLLRLQAEGVTRLLECGAGRVLCGLSQRTVPEIAAASLSTPQDIEAYARQLQET